MACAQPISYGFEDNNNKYPMLTDDVTENSIFETIRSRGDIITPILMVDECNGFLMNVIRREEE